MEIDKKYISLSKEEFEKQRKFILCSYCEKIMIEPVQCSNCLNNYCLKCIKDLPNNKITLFFSQIFTKKENICAHDKYGESNECKTEISHLTIICKNSCGLTIDIKEVSNHLEYKCPKLEFLSKVGELNKTIDNLEKSNIALKMSNEVLLKRYHQEIKKLNPWVTHPNGIRSKYHQHELQENNNTMRSWVCNICNVEHSRNQNSLHCRKCYMDLCFECFVNSLFVE